MGGQPIQPTILLNLHRCGCRLTRMKIPLRMPKRNRRCVPGRESLELEVELRYGQKFRPVLAVPRGIPERLAFLGYAWKRESEPQLHCPHS
jgi:hypothetical protein